jgi:prepilin-type N-terminal cleavage/methylation domain-containing protein/prepilin-type processing-associated H-X9-DG protein
VRLQSTRGGFTLIELLVVVAIIAVLIAILLPALKGAKDQSKQLLCNTNLRTLGQSAAFYAQDNKDTLVRSESNRMHFAASLLPGLGYDQAVHNIWRVGNPEKLAEACAEQKPLQCPNFPKPEQPLDYVINAFEDPYEAFGGDGGSSGTIGNGPISSTRPRIFFSRLTDFKARNPAGLIHLTEAHENHALPRAAGTWGQLHDLFQLSHLPFSTQPRIANDPRHPGGINALYFDGHAKTMPYPMMDSGWPHERSDRLRFFVSAVIQP